ncbi:MAG: undecaprenyldiphospho-muramoylpentapeptide beta-N-acetylglucosaminyltransferase [Bryobacteraceae bacterium]
MKSRRAFVMAGGGTGGHIIPALAVASELRRRGHEPFFFGTRSGMEARLVPAEGFPIEWISIGGLNRVGLLQTLRTLWQLPASILRVMRVIGEKKPAAVFSMGGYVAGPVALAALLKGIPIVLMEPNAVPGLVNRRIARYVSRALVNFPETAQFFPPGRSEITGVPVRPEFFRLPPGTAGEGDQFTILITGGSRGSRTLNRAVRESWPLFAGSGAPVRIIHQAGAEAHSKLAEDFEKTRLEGYVAPFIEDMPAAFAAADLIVCRSGASTVSELAAAGKAAVLVPFPFAADNHQLRNAEALARAGAARLVTDKEMTGQRLFDEYLALKTEPEELRAMAAKIREFARPQAAEKAADVLESLLVR